MDKVSNLTFGPKHPHIINEEKVDKEGVCQTKENVRMKCVIAQPEGIRSIAAIIARTLLTRT